MTAARTTQGSSCTPRCPVRGPTSSSLSLHFGVLPQEYASRADVLLPTVAPSPPVVRWWRSADTVSRAGGTVGARAAGRGSGPRLSVNRGEHIMDLALLASVGGFFALRATPVPGGGHQPLERLYAGANAPLTARVDKVAARLAAPERRVAASIAHLGLAARLWSLALGRPRSSGAYPTWGPASCTGTRRPPRPTTCGSRGRRSCPARRPSSASRSSTGTWCRWPRRSGGRGTSPRGSCGATRVRARRGRTRTRRVRARPGPAGRGRAGAALAAELFDDEALRSTGAPHGPAFRRRSCCLYWRCPGGGLCGDCVFDSAPGSAAKDR